MAIILGPLTVDQSRDRATLSGRTLALRPLDLRVLALLARHPRRVLTREVIGGYVWGPDATVDPRGIDGSVKRLRRALDGAGDAIVTVRRVGYRLDPVRLAEVTSAR